jgi:hypothetical protein
MSDLQDDTKGLIERAEAGDETVREFAASIRKRFDDDMMELLGWKTAMEASALARGEGQDGIDAIRERAARYQEEASRTLRDALRSLLRWADARQEAAEEPPPLPEA